MGHWYDFAAVPLMNIPKTCEELESLGFEILCVFNTGALGEIRTAGILSSAKPQVAPIMGIVVRHEILKDYPQNRVSIETAREARRIRDEEIADEVRRDDEYEEHKDD